jgi:hypothetical protein
VRTFPFLFRLNSYTNTTPDLGNADPVGFVKPGKTHLGTDWSRHGCEFLLEHGGWSLVSFFGELQ